MFSVEVPHIERLVRRHPDEIFWRRELYRAVRSRRSPRRVVIDALVELAKREASG